MQQEVFAFMCIYLILSTILALVGLALASTETDDSMSERVANIAEFILRANLLLSIGFVVVMTATERMIQ